MGLRELLRQLGTDEGGPLCECRFCGVTVTPEAQECPDCGSTEIARYYLD